MIATKKERKELMLRYGYTEKQIDALAIASEKLRACETVPFMSAVRAAYYNRELEAIRNETRI